MMIKQSVVDVLMFLFEQCMDDEMDVFDERDHMQLKLEEFGFQHREIDEAFDWLEGLALIQDGESYAPMSENSIRVFSEEERALLNEECLGFLVFLEQTQILTPVTRELILDRVTALNHVLDIEQMKWIVMIVLHTHPGEESAFAWMESLVFDEVVDLMQ